MTIQTELKNFSHRTQLGDFLNGRGLTGKGVEVGTLFGAHATDILKTWKGHLYCVDPWENQPESVYFDGANKQDMNQVFSQVCKTIGKHPRCTLYRMMSLNAVGMFDDEELSFCYLDGNHGLQHIRADIAAWWPKVKIGGLVSGHDYFTRYDNDTDSDAGTAVAELAEALGIRVHVTWDTSWWFIKTKEADDAFRKANIASILPRPVYTDNSRLPLAVVIPVAKFDWNLAVKMLTWWKLMLGGHPNPFPTIAYCTHELEQEHLDALGDSGLPNLSIVVAKDLKELGYFGSPNQVIKGALEYVEKTLPGHAMLWAEADTVPMCADWVQRISAEYKTCGRPFMGDVFRAEGAVAHLSGNAVYHPNWRKLAPSLAALGQEECGWDTLCAHDTLPRSHKAKTIQQIWRPALPITAEWAAKNIRPDCALFHQVKDGSLIDVLCARDGIEVIPLSPALCKSTYETQKVNLRNIGPSVGRGVIVQGIGSSAPLAADPDIDPVEILIVTFARDMDFLRYCLKSIEKFCRGFSGVTIAVPEHDRGKFDWAARRTKVVYFNEPEGKGMLAHEIQVCRADELCPYAAAVLHVDADCIFWRNCTPKDFAPGGKPLMVRERYADLLNSNRRIWQKCVESAIGLKPEYECMVRHPNIHLRGVYERTRWLVEKHTGKAFDDYVLSCDNAFPQGFAEFPLLGAVAISHYRDQYTCVDYSPQRDASECGAALGSFQYIYRRDRDFLAECWSHGGIERYKSDIEAWLNGKTPAYFVK